MAIVGLLAVAAPRPASAASILFDSIPNPLPINLPSWGFASNQTTELGQEIGLTSGGLFNLSVAALMSNWAYESLFEPLGTSLGYSLAMKLARHQAQ